MIIGEMITEEKHSKKWKHSVGESEDLWRRKDEEKKTENANEYP